MGDKLFTAAMYILFTLIICGIIFALAIKIATLIAIIVLISPFAAAIIWKIKKLSRQHSN